MKTTRSTTPPIHETPDDHSIHQQVQTINIHQSNHNTTHTITHTYIQAHKKTNRHSHTQRNTDIEHLICTRAIMFSTLRLPCKRTVNVACLSALSLSSEGSGVCVCECAFVCVRVSVFVRVCVCVRVSFVAVEK